MPRAFTDYDLARFRRAHGEPDLPLPKKRKKRDNREHQTQAALIKWWAIRCRTLGLPEHLLFAIPNGGWRDPVGAAILKSEGQRNGVSDLMLALPRGTYAGLFVEMKHEDGSSTREQKAFIADVRKQGYMADFAYGFDDAVRFIEAYLRGDQFL